MSRNVIGALRKRKTNPMAHRGARVTSIVGERRKTNPFEANVFRPQNRVRSLKTRETRVRCDRAGYQTNPTAHGGAPLWRVSVEFDGPACVYQ
jgi:hypothetical protein